MEGWRFHSKYTDLEFSRTQYKFAFGPDNLAPQLAFLAGCDGDIKAELFADLLQCRGGGIGNREGFEFAPGGRVA